MNSIKNRGPNWKRLFGYKTKAPGLSRRASDGIRTRKGGLERTIFGHDWIACIGRSCE
jgi:hypothetical protein